MLFRKSKFHLFGDLKQQPPLKPPHPLLDERLDAHTIAKTHVETSSAPVCFRKEGRSPPRFLANKFLRHRASAQRQQQKTKRRQQKALSLSSALIHIIQPEIARLYPDHDSFFRSLPLTPRGAGAPNPPIREHRFQETCYASVLAKVSVSSVRLCPFLMELIR